MTRGMITGAAAVFLATIFLATLVLGTAGDDTALAGDDDVILLAYDVSDIVRKVRHFPAPKLGLQGIEEAEDPFDVDDEDDGPVFGVEDIIDLIKEHVAPGTWDDGPNSITSSGTVIFITIDPSRTKQVAATLEGLRVKSVKPVTIEARVLALSPEQLADLGFAKKSKRSRLIKKEEGEALLAPILEHSDVALGAPRITAWENQRTHSLIVDQSAYIADAEVNEATGTVDPVIEVLNEGIVFEVVAKPRARGKKMLLEWSVTLAHRGDTQFEEADGDVVVELPRIEKSISEGRGIMRRDQLLFVRGLRSPKIGDGEGVLVLSWDRPKDSKKPVAKQDF